MGRTSQYPVPKKKYRRGTWEIYWNYKKKRYSFYPGRQDEQDRGIDVDMRRIAGILASPEPDFPSDWLASPGIRQYQKDRFGIDDELSDSPTYSPAVLLNDYKKNLELSCARNWAKTSIAIVNAMDAFTVNGILQATPIDAGKFLESLLERGLSVATRNRSLAACSRFFKWCQANGYREDNPFSGIKTQKEADAEEIVYCTKEERNRILAAAKKSGRPDWLAIPIALYAGCRREEIFRLQWEDVNLDNRRMVIRKSKTGRQRAIPIAKDLLALLEPHKKAFGPVVVLPGDGTWGNYADRLIELAREQLCRPENPDDKGNPSEAIGKRLFMHTANDLRDIDVKLANMKKSLSKIKSAKKAAALAGRIENMENRSNVSHDGGEWMPAERIRWNAFRHTFGSLLAQAGVSLDKISSWMGNTPEVCRRHYTQFMPRDRHDEEIDLL